MLQFSSIQPLSRVWLFATPWTAAHQASMFITISWSLLKLMSLELVMPLNHLILCHPLLLLPSIFPSIGSFQMSQFFASGGQNIGVSASVSVFPMNIQDWFPLGLTDWIFLQSKGLSRIFSSYTIQKHQFFGTQTSLWSNSHMCTWSLGFLGGSVVKNPPTNAGEEGWIAGLGRFPGGGNVNPLQFSCLENSQELLSYSSWCCRVGHDWALSCRTREEANIQV